jgi:predicted transporter
LIIWGVLTLRRPQKEADNSGKVLTQSLLLVVPCPVCVTAITFALWSALSIIQFPAVLVGLGMGIVFSLLAVMIIILAVKAGSDSPDTSLGLGMIAIGFYFIASLFLPAKIEEAKAVYATFLEKGSNLDIVNTLGVILILFVCMAIGFLANTRRGIK